MAFRTPARLWEPSIVHQHDFAGQQGRYEHLLDVGKEPRAIDGTVEDTRSTVTPSWNMGSDAISMMFRHAYDAPISLAWRRSIFARPYIWRFTSLSLFI